MAGEAIVQIVPVPIGKVETSDGALVAVEAKTSSVVTLGLQGPPGADGESAAAVVVRNEVPTGVINGSNATFTTAHNFTPGSVKVAVNGLIQRPVTDFNTSGQNTILFSDSPRTGDSILIDYLRS